MPFKKILSIGQHEEDEEIDDEEEKQVSLIFPGAGFPKTSIPYRFVKDLVRKLPERRVKIESAIKEIGPDRFIMKK